MRSDAAGRFFMKRLLLAVLLATPLCAQSFCVAGAAMLPQTSPKTTGFEACAAVLSSANQIWSITGNQLNMTPQKKIQAVAFSGIATVCHVFSFATLYCFGAPAGATTGTNASLAVTGGFIGTFPVKGGKWGFFTPGYSVVKSNAGATGTILIGWGYKL